MRVFVECKARLAELTVGQGSHTPNIWGLKQNTMLVSTTSHLEGRSIASYHGVVFGETIIGANIFKDFFAGIRDIVGGRSGSYEDVLARARKQALEEMQAEAQRVGGNAVIGVDIDYEVLGSNGSMLMVSCSGTAVVV